MWTADITNDPDHDCRLYLELLEGDEYRGKITLDGAGKIELTIYECAQPVRIPGEWLMEMLAGAKADLIE